MIPLLIFALFVAVTVAELWLILEVGSMIGAPATILLLIADSVLGAWLMRSQGSAVWTRFRATVDAGRVPAAEAVDGFLVILGGTLLLVPGFISDFFGLLFVLPPSRRLMRNRVVRRLGGKNDAVFMGGFVADDTHVRDFDHSDQPRRRRARPEDEQPSDFDLKTPQISE